LNWIAVMGAMGDASAKFVEPDCQPPEAPRDAAAEYEAAHIPGAAFMNLAELRDTDADLPMTRTSVATERILAEDDVAALFVQ